MANSNMDAKAGSGTIGAAGDNKDRVRLFKDDRQEDIGAIIVAALIVALVLVVTMWR